MHKIIHRIQLSKKITDGNGHDLKRLGLGVAGNYGIYQLEVVPGEEWQGLTVTAVFQGEWGRVEELLTGNLIDVPPQATALPTTDTPGKITFVGVDLQGRNVSTGIAYYVEDGGCISGDKPELPEDKWQQLVAKFDKAVPPSETDGLVLHSGGTDAANYWAAGSNGGTGDYNDLTNKPQINGVELAGKKTWTDFGIPDVVAFAEAAAQSAQNAADAAGSAANAVTEAQSSAANASAKAEESASSAQSAFQSATSAESSAQQSAGSASAAADSASQAETAAGKIPDPSGVGNAYLASNAEGTGYTLVPMSQIVQAVLAALPIYGGEVTDIG